MSKKRSATTGRYVTVTSAQRRAAGTLVSRSAKTGKSVSPSVRKIADAKTVRNVDTSRTN